MFPETTREQAEQLVTSFGYGVQVGDKGYNLYAEIVEAGIQPVALEVDGKWTWCEQPAYNVVFKGGKWGEHTLRLATSSVERIRAHWEGYVAAHTQEAERKEKLALVPSGTRYQPKVWVAKVGDRVFFPRGMFGKWQGSIVRLYEARGHIGVKKGTVLCDVTCVGRNGKMYHYRRVPVASLTKGGVAPHLENP